MKKQILLLCSFLLSILFAAGCSNKTKNKANDRAASDSTFDIGSARKQIEETNHQFMDLFVKGDSVGIANLYTADAKFMNAGAPAIVGKAAIQSAMSAFMKSGLTKVDFKTTDVFGSEVLIAEEGELKLFVKDKMVGEEKYIVLWKKENGQWKLFRDISNSDLPESGSK